MEVIRRRAKRLHIATGSMPSKETKRAQNSHCVDKSHFLSMPVSAI